MASLIDIFLLTTISLVVAQAVWNYRRLASSDIPGPFLASITDLWRAYSMHQTHYAEKVASLHRKYGKLVRLGPGFVSVNDPDALPIIFATTKSWRKGDSYKVLIGLNEGKEVPSIVSTLDENRHTLMKRAVGSAFATNNLLDYEHCIDECTHELFEVLRKNRSVDIVRWISYATMDMLSRMAFSESLGFLAQGTDIGGTMKSIEDRFKHWTDWSAIPELERLILRNSLTKRMSGGSSPLTRLAAQKLNARKTATERPSQRDLLQKYIDASDKYPEALTSDNVLGMTMSTIAAGADTTSTTLAAALFFLLKHPCIHDTLLAEIKAAHAAHALSIPPRWEEVNKLRYLDAVLKETMRCYPIANVSIDRMVPQGGVQISGKFIPEGTQIGCQQLTIHRVKEVWGDDVDTFRPERWLDEDETRRRKMDKAFLGFSMGKRICIGLHIAQLEMKKLLPEMMLNFKMKLDDPMAELAPKSRGGVRYPGSIWLTFEDRLLSQ